MKNKKPIAPNEPVATAQTRPNKSSHPIGRRILAGAIAVPAALGIVHHEASQNSRAKAQADKIAQLQGHLNRMAGITSVLEDIDKKTLVGEGLKKVSELPGYGKEIGERQRQMLEQATLKIIKRVKGSKGAWQDHCTAVKVNIDGSTYIATAAHCFGEESNKVVRKEMPTQASAVNVAKISAYEYAVVDPHEDPLTRNSQSPLATVNGISINIQDVDWALLATADAPKNKGGGQRSYENIPAVPYRSISQLPTLPGETVGLYGVPAASGNKPVMGKGIFLGTVADPLNQLRYLDLVGLSTVTAPGNDACNYGASGSAVIFRDGSISGPLSMRNHITYGEGKPDTPPDDPKNGQLNRLMYEKAIGIDLNDFTTICGYSSLDSSTLPDLVKGFSVTDFYVYGPEVTGRSPNKGGSGD